VDGEPHAQQYKDDRNSFAATIQFPLWIRSRHARHGEVEDQTLGLADAIGRDELFRRRDRALALHALYAGLWRARGIPHGTRNPERVEALIFQDVVAHNDGLGVNWKARRPFWADRAANESTLRVNLLSLATTRTRHVRNDPTLDRYDPDLWTDEFAFLSQSGQAEIQNDMFFDYRTNVEAYPKWQAWMREKQLRLLVMIWGKYDLSFDPSARSLSARCAECPSSHS
jgi:hypothetical protein